MSPGALLYPFDRAWAIADAAALACMLEASAFKAGNVSALHAFSDTSTSHFLVSALQVRDILEADSGDSLGALVYRMVARTRESVGLNTNLGICLLIAPIALAKRRFPEDSTADAVARILQTLSAADSRDVYEAIRAAQPGGLGEAANDEPDVAHEPPESLRDAMQAAAHRDSIARQYVSDFEDIFEFLVPSLMSDLRKWSAHANGVLEAILVLQLRWMAERRDSLIVRKCGQAIADEACQLARLALQEVEEQDSAERANRSVTQGTHWKRLHAFLCADGNKRNPGTTADLIAAALMVCLCDC